MPAIVKGGFSTTAGGVARFYTGVFGVHELQGSDSGILNQRAGKQPSRRMGVGVVLLGRVECTTVTRWFYAKGFGGACLS